MTPEARDELPSPAQRRRALERLVLSNPLHAEVTARRLDRMIDVALGRLGSLTVVLENLVDPHNVSAVLRSAEGLGLADVHLVEDPSPARLNVDVVRGADRWLRVHRYRDLDRCISRLRDLGFVLAAADVGTDCVPIDRLPADQPLAVVLGSEASGLTKRARDLCDLRFTIPMPGMTESFNVSVSAALTLWELSRRRSKCLSAASGGIEGDLGIDEAARLVGSWLQRARSH